MENCCCYRLHMLYHMHNVLHIRDVKRVHITHTFYFLFFYGSRNIEIYFKRKIYTRSQNVRERERAVYLDSLFLVKKKKILYGFCIHSSIFVRHVQFFFLTPLLRRKKNLFRSRFEVMQKENKHIWLNM